MLCRAAAWALGLALVAALPALPVDATPASTAGTTSASALRMLRTARSASIGDVTALDRGIDGAWGNPAALLSIDDRQVVLSRVQSFAAITYNVVGYGQRAGRRSAMAATYADVDYGEIDGRDITGRATGRVQAGMDVGTFSVAQSLTSYLDIGITARVVSERLGRYTDNTFTADIGAVLHLPGTGTRISVVGQNLVGSLRFALESYDLPATVRIGTSRSFSGDFALAGIEAIKGEDTDWEFAAGIELKAAEFMVLRAGAVYSINDEFRVSGGAGVRARRFRIDYGYSPRLQAVGDQHRVTLMVTF